MGRIPWTPFFLLGALTIGASAQEPPVEFGAVRWMRDFEAGMERARATQRPALLLFQEVPG